MARNMVQFQKGLSEPAFEHQYGTENQCRAAVIQLRWPNGFECPACGGRTHCLVKSRDLFQCTGCRRQTSPIAGTIFASTKLPLRTWFRAMYHMTQTKQGISSIELGRRLGVTQTTAWKIKHKLQQVMMERDATKKLTGRVEIDDAYLGGERSGGKRGRGAAGKTPFVAAVETTVEGKPVSILADGAAQPAETVASGQIVLDRNFTKVLAGLPYTSTILPMKFDFELRDGPTRGRKKRVNRVEVSLYKSLAGQASTNGTEWLWVYPRDFSDPMDASPPPFSGDAEVVLAGDYSEDADIYLRQNLPYPLTVRALVAKLDAFGD